MWCCRVTFSDSPWPTVNRRDRWCTPSGHATSPVVVEVSQSGGRLRRRRALCATIGLRRRRSPRRVGCALAGRMADVRWLEARRHPSVRSPVRLGHDVDGGAHVAVPWTRAGGAMSGAAGSVGEVGWGGDWSALVHCTVRVFATLHRYATPLGVAWIALSIAWIAPVDCTDAYRIAPYCGRTMCSENHRTDANLRQIL